MLGFYNYTVVLTYIGLLISCFGIGRAMEGDLQGAMLCLLLSGLCDMFDGKIASTRPRTEQEKAFGIQIDSLSDLVCFAVLPALLLCRAAGRLLPVAPLFVLCGLIRLAWFNVDEAERQASSEGERCIYYGLPITSTALLIPALYLFSRCLSLSFSGLAQAVLCVTGLCFLLPFRLKKPGLPGKLLLIAAGTAELVLLLAGLPV